MLLLLMPCSADALDSIDPVENMALSSYNGLEAAVMGYKRLIEERTEPKKHLTTEAKALNEKALEFIKQQQYETAIPLLEEANQLDPYDIEIMNNFGFVLSKSEQLGRDRNR